MVSYRLSSLNQLTLDQYAAIIRRLRPLPLVAAYMKYYQLTLDRHAAIIRRLRPLPTPTMVAEPVLNINSCAFQFISVGSVI